MQKHIIGCWQCDFSKILLTTYKNTSLIRINRWIQWQPAQFRQVGSLLSNSTWVDSSGCCIILTTNSAWFGLDSDPDLK
jgi:hypothetical protein